MPLQIPYTFIAGTKAKANEVNANFLAIKNLVDTIEVTQTEQGNDITALLAQKADLNGNQGELFRVADAESDYDAINKATLEELTYNTRALFWGLELTRIGDDTISVSPGGTYDSTFEYMIKSEITLTKQQSNLGNEATWYVYICAEEGEENLIVFSANGTTPEVPVGYSYFKRLGYFTTNEEGDIDQVFSESATGTNKDAAWKRYACGFIGGLVYQGGAQSSGKSFDFNTWLSVRSNGDNNKLRVYIDGVQVAYCGSASGRNTGACVMVPLMKGQEFMATGTGIQVQVFEMIYEEV